MPTNTTPGQVRRDITITGAPEDIVDLVERLRASGQAAGLTIDGAPAASATGTSDGVAQVVPAAPPPSGVT